MKTIIFRVDVKLGFYLRIDGIYPRVNLVSLVWLGPVPSDKV